MIKYNCPHCNNELNIPEEYAGKSGTCKRCGKAISVPTLEFELSDLATKKSHNDTDSAHEHSVNEETNTTSKKREGLQKPKSLRRKKYLFLVVLLLISSTLGFIISGPYRTISSIKSAVANQDSKKLEAHIDFPDLRQNLKDQFNASLTKDLLEDLDDNPFGLLAAGLATTLVDSFVDTLITPAGLANLMEGAKVSVDNIANTEPIDKNELFENARYTFDSTSRFSAWVPDEVGDETRFILERQGLSWKLVNIYVSIDSSVEEKKNERVASKNNSSSASKKIELVKNPDFRNTNWGMSMSEVQKHEDIELTKEDATTLAGKTSIAGLSTQLGYIFFKNQLAQAIYMINENHSNDTEYISDYEDLKNLLVEKYGKPSMDEIFWKNDLYEDDPENYGMAISVGHLTYMSKWDFSDTNLILILSGDNYDINFGIAYYSKELENDMDAETKNNSLSNL